MANDMAGKSPIVRSTEIKDSMEQYVLLDSREKEEYQVSHIAGSRWVGYDNFDLAQLNDLPKDSKIVVYCSVGYRSGKVVEKLMKSGFSNVQNLWGGIFYWVNMGYEVENEKGVTPDIHPYSAKWGKWLNKGTKKYE